MSEIAILPEKPVAAPAHPATPRRMMSAIALVSFASLLLELSLTRLFSVVLFYHFAFLAISVALLGLGAGGVFAYLGRAFLARFSTRKLGATLSLINAVVIVLALEVVVHVPVSLELSRANFRKLTIIYLAAAVPFFFTGLLFAVAFARETLRVSLLYGADLIGGALACMAVVPVLNFVGGPNAVLLAAASMAAAGVLWAGIESEGAPLKPDFGLSGDPDASSQPPSAFSRASRNLCAAVALLLLIAIGVNFHGRLIDIVYAKGMRRDRPWMLFARWNAISRVEVNQVGESKYIVIDADASTAIMNVDPKRWSEDQHPTPHDNGLPQQSTYNWKRDLMAAAPAVANVLRPRGDFAIIGPGGGVDVLRAVANGSPNVTGVEINNIIVNQIMKGAYADYAYHLYELPQVHIHVADGRSWIRASHDQYDVVQMTLVDTWASTAAGAFALSENNLYTTQAFREYFDHLKPDGFIAITRWEFAKPREALRVVSQELAALDQVAGEVYTYAPNFIVVSDGALDEDGRPVTVLAKKTPFTRQEVQDVLVHLALNPNLHVIYAAGVDDAAIARTGAQLAVDSARQPFRDLIESARAAGPHAEYGATPKAKFIASYPYDISPVSDNEPFFFFTLKTRDVVRDTLRGTGKGMDWRINLGIVVLGLLFLMSIAAVLLFLVVPLAVHGLRRRIGNEKQIPRRFAARDDNSEGTADPDDGQLRDERQLRATTPVQDCHHERAEAREGSAFRSARETSRVGPLLYFVAIGLGYILVEIAFIQRFCLFLGHPTYALTVVVFLMLISSGLGSMAGRRMLRDSRRVRAVLALIVIGVLVLVAALPLLLASLVGLPFLVKLVISAALLVPLGFCMGMPFPTGLRALASRHTGDSLVEWAWAMNAAASVLGSVLAIIIAIHFGLNVTLATGALAYALATGFTVPLMRRTRFGRWEN